MKKLMYLAVVAFTLGFTSCGNDDDGGNCRECILQTSICDNGNGTASVEGDATQYPIPDEQSFDEFVDTFCSGDITIGF
ncbi:hypothetical protein J8281_02865 [Aquimarina sp. U1-2]|uniref:hypothetical protein n=1 Tax=Aquimarina sp. U1-2 TaxID=2823141 RepID=UPI001AEC75BA|nr:hypothetical protein [Aquimarina sp. U1-2]MBP2831118.1 hypothetical protein [Aquimarina sp. U1-2]